MNEREEGVTEGVVGHFVMITSRSISRSGSKAFHS